MSKHYIYNGQIYSEDELMHASHKYIKREWKNGKWQYYYELPNGKRTDSKLLSKVSDAVGEDEKEQYRLDKVDYLQKKIKHDEVKKALDDSEYKQQLYIARNSSGKKTQREADNFYKEVEKMSDEIAANRDNEKKLRAIAVEAYTKQYASKWYYDRSFMSKIDKGKSSLSKLLKKKQKHDGKGRDM